MVLIYKNNKSVQYYNFFKTIAIPIFNTNYFYSQIETSSQVPNDKKGLFIMFTFGKSYLLNLDNQNIIILSKYYIIFIE